MKRLEKEKFLGSRKKELAEGKGGKSDFSGLFQSARRTTRSMSRPRGGAIANHLASTSSSVWRGRKCTTLVNVELLSTSGAGGKKSTSGKMRKKKPSSKPLLTVDDFKAEAVETNPESGVPAEKRMSCKKLEC